MRWVRAKKDYFHSGTGERLLIEGKQYELMLICGKKYKVRLDNGKPFPLDKELFEIMSV